MEETMRHSQERWERIKENYEKSDSFGASTGSSFDHGEYRDFEQRFSKRVVAAILAIAVAVFVVDHTYKAKPEDSNKFLADLKRKKEEQKERKSAEK